MVQLREIYAKVIGQLHWIYLAYAIPMVCICAWLTPPFQVPDEPNHFKRAEQITRGVVVPTFKFAEGEQPVDMMKDSVIYPYKGGFQVDKAISTVMGAIYPELPEGNIVLDRDKLNAVKDEHWGQGYSYDNFANTAIYAPVVYVMPALGIIIGKALHLTVVKTLLLSRLLNALLAVAISCIAIRHAGCSKLLLFTVLLLPMVIVLYASVSQDAVLICCSFLLIALIDRLEFGKQGKYKTSHVLLLTILACMIGLSKPPYAIMFLLLFPFLHLTARQKLWMITIPVMLTIGWVMLVKDNLGIPWAPAELHLNAKLQVASIKENPFAFIAMFFKPDLNGIYCSALEFVGVLGWLKLILPFKYYVLSFFIILLAGFLSFQKAALKNHVVLRLVLFVSAVATLVVVLAVQYVTWTSLGTTHLSGMQGRYLLPIFPVLALSIAGLRDVAAKNYQSWLLLPLVLYPIISGAVIVWAILGRFY